MVIREAHASDAQSLLRMAFALVDSFLVRVPCLAVDLPGVTRRLVEGLALERRDGRLLVAELDGALHGVMGAIRVEQETTGEDYAQEVIWWVDPPYRSRGVGPALLQAVENWARSVDLRMLKLEAPIASRAGKYLARHGFVPVEVTFVKELYGLVRGGQQGSSEDDDAQRYPDHRP